MPSQEAEYLPVIDTRPKPQFFPPPPPGGVASAPPNPPPKPELPPLDNFGRGCLAVVLLIVVGWVWQFGYWITGPHETDIADSGIGIVRRAIEDGARSPRAIKLDWDWIQYIGRDGHVYSYSGHFDAQNGFGAWTRVHFWATVEDEDGDGKRLRLDGFGRL